MARLEDFAFVNNNLKTARRNSIVALHKYVFEYEGDRSNRKRLRKFVGFEFDESSDEYNKKMQYINNQLSESDLTTICIILGIEYNREDVAHHIFKNLQKFKLLNSTNNEDDNDDEQTNTEEEIESEGENDNANGIASSLHSLNVNDVTKGKSSKAEHHEGAYFSLNIRDLEGSIREFDGSDNLPIEVWVQEFEEMSSIMKWNDFLKFVFAKKSLKGCARTFILSEKGVTTWKKLKEVLINEFTLKVTSKEIHKQLNERKQRKDENLHEYFYKMKDLARQGSVEDEALMQYIIDGIKDTNASKAMLYGARGLKQFKEKLYDYEKFISRQPSFNQGQLNTKKTATTQQSDGNKTITKCFNCGDKGHKSADCSNKAKGTKCFKCNAFGHIAKDCKTGKSKQQEHNVNCLISETTTEKKIKINNFQFNALIDTGSNLNIMTKKVYEQLGKPKLAQSNILLKGFGGKQNKTRPIGHLDATIEIDDVYYKLQFQVAPNESTDAEIIIGKPIIRQAELIFNHDGVQIRKAELQQETVNDELPKIMKIDVADDHEVNIDESASPVAKNKISELIQNYKPEKTKTTNVCMKIILNNDVPVYSQPRRLPLYERQLVDAQIEEWLKEGIIEPTESEYSSPIVLVAKKNGTKRLCVDYRRLNRIMIKDRYPLPLIEDQLDRLQNAKIFSTIDLRNGFFHVNVDKDSRKYTTFVTHDSQYQFNKVPFGLCNSPAVFQRHINAIFRKLTQRGIALPYIDDIIIPSENEEEAIKNLIEVLTTCKEYGLDINWKKSHFLKKRIQFLGHVIENQKIYPSPEKVQAVLKYPLPRNLKEVESFLGLVGYFRKFMPNFSQIAKPLSDLRKKDANFQMNGNEIQAFDNLKKLLSEDPVLKIFNEKHQTELHADASIDGFGAVLMQKFPEDGQLHPTYFMSKKTTDAQKKYTSYELEILAVVEALKKFRVYLLGIPFKIVTDCDAFAKTMEKKDLCTRVARWLLMLQEYEYVIEHRTGTRMRHVDALSRHAIMTINEVDLIAKIKYAQGQDDSIKPIIKIMQENGEYENYYLKSGVLYKVIDESEKLVVPKVLQYEIIKKAHEKGHFAIKKTKEIINQDYFIPKLDEKIQNCIANCLPCLLTNRKIGKQEGELNPLKKPDTPLHTYHVDFLGPLESTNKAYKHILVVIDAFSKFAWLYPTKSTTAHELITKLSQQSTVFGNPNVIISDRGSAFMSDDFREYCQTEQITHLKITTGLPRANGQVERLNSVITAVLSKLSVNDPTKWYRHVQQVQRTINSTFHRSINHTPFEILMGVKMRSKDDLLVKEAIEAEFIAQFESMREELRNDAKLQIAKVQDENRRTYNLRRKTATQYKVGDLVAIKRTQFGGGLKLKPKFLGPYRIEKVKANNTYDVVKIGESEGSSRTNTCAEYMKCWPGNFNFGSKL